MLCFKASQRIDSMCSTRSGRLAPTRTIDRCSKLSTTPSNRKSNRSHSPSPKATRSLLSLSLSLIISSFLPLLLIPLCLRPVIVLKFLSIRWFVIAHPVCGSPVPVSSPLPSSQLVECNSVCTKNLLIHFRCLSEFARE